MNCHFVGFMYGMPCTKFPYFVPIGQLIWPPKAVLLVIGQFRKSSLRPFSQSN